MTKYITGRTDLSGAIVDIYIGPSVVTWRVFVVLRHRRCRCYSAAC